MGELGNRVIIIACMVFLVAGALLSYFLVQEQRESSQQQTLDTQFVKTKYAASQIEAHITRIRDGLLSMRSEARFVKGCPTEPALSGSRVPFVFANVQGTIITCSVSEYEDYAGLNIKDNDYFTIPKNSKEPYITVIRQSTPQVVVAVPVFSPSFSGVLLHFMEVEQLYNLYILPAAQQGNFVILNDAGNVITQSAGLNDSSILSSIGRKSEVPASLRTLPELGRVYLTSADILIGQEQWKLYVLAKPRTAFPWFWALGGLLLIPVLLLLSMLRKNKVQTMKQLGLVPQTEGASFSTADFALEPGRCYLLKDGQAWEFFLGALGKGYQGFACTRVDPRTVRQKYHLLRTPLLWLTETKVAGMPTEHELNAIFTYAQEFVAAPKRVLLLEGMEYLIHKNGFSAVLAKIHGLNDAVRLHDSIAILTIEPDAVSAEELKALEAITTDAYKPDGQLQLPPLEKSILQYINAHNITNSLVSYKEITRQFDITKPTTRVKINHLEALGLVQVEQQGRFKSIRITSKGRAVV